ncbi:hypothetical protein HBI83_224740 [Parastagonospora nodorum]|nr:hypothetical protein HBI83_224740 [Parastagonospora nodorum]
MRFQLTHVLCLLATADALTLGKRQTANSYEELLDTPEDVATLEARTDIVVIAGMVTTGLTATLSILTIANYLAEHIKYQSEIKSCSVISGNFEDAVWQYVATTSGNNCDTTAQTKTIKNAVQRELEWMERNRYTSACFKMDHGGTWEGHLKVSLAGVPLASDGKCNEAKYDNI